MDEINPDSENDEETAFTPEQMDRYRENLRKRIKNEDEQEESLTEALREGYKSCDAILYGLTELQEMIKKEDEHPEDRLNRIDA